ncbi:5-oxoprolinase [Histoplasma ohiense]|nr:5-oxoprolinase [Histoplasma ohiense (nom. inval.)]
MTNTHISDSEVFERRHPVLIREFCLRPGSGGNGQHRGGDGVIRDIDFRIRVQVSILSERRVYHPHGLNGGEDGQCVLNIWMRRTPIRGHPGKWNVKEINPGAKNTVKIYPGDRIVVKTLGRGG